MALDSIIHLLLSLCCVSLQEVSVSGMLAKCKSIRSVELYLDKGPKSLASLNYWIEGVRDSPSIDNLSICCLDTGQWCPALGLLLFGPVWCTSSMALSVSNVFDE